MLSNQHYPHRANQKLRSWANAVFQNRAVCGQAVPSFPSPSPVINFFLLLSQLSRRTSPGNACYAGYSPNASSVYIRLCKHRKKVFYCFYKITFPRKKRKTLCMALIKREILTSRKILSAKSCTRNQFLFCKKMLCKIRIFLA